ncbi:MAG: lipocalin-like domain-containing protein [Bacteroidetes bacterium]|nr:lipocalin-like domain-containing protein [Bacteroidota bacterium]
MGSPILTSPSGDLATALRGIWWLQTREDWTKDGQKRIDPTLGADPIGILSYSGTHFAAQFMKRDRSKDAAGQVTSYSGSNNTVAVDGYDAYFGTYEVDEQSGKVAHTLVGSITPANIGITASRDMRADADRLVIQLETTRPDGEPITRTLTWKRLN